MKKVFEDSELEEDSVIRNFRITAADGKTYDTNTRLEKIFVRPHRDQNEAKISSNCSPLALPLALHRRGAHPRWMLAYLPTRWLTLSLALVAGALSGAACGGSALDESPDAENGDGDEESGPSDSDECIPYDDDCAEGHYCQYVDGHTQCIPEGGVLRDDPCEEDLCQQGSICMYADSIYGNHCQQPCNLAEERPCDLPRHTCFVAVDDEGQDLWFGVCRY